MQKIITKTALRRIYVGAEPKCQLDLFIDKEAVARGALRQLREADRLAEEAGISFVLSSRSGQVDAVGLLPRDHHRRL